MIDSSIVIHFNGTIIGIEKGDKFCIGDRYYRVTHYSRDVTRHVIYYEEISKEEYDEDQKPSETIGYFIS